MEFKLQFEQKYAVSGEIKSPDVAPDGENHVKIDKPLNK